MKKIGIYDPYFHILGGAERYVFSIAKCFTRTGVTFYGGDGLIFKKVQEKFGLTLKEATMKPWQNERNLRNRELKGLDIFFYVTDGSLFWANARKNILIIQTPDHIPKRSVVNTVKLWSWQKIICYSEFIADFIAERLGKKPEVLFVPITGTSRASLKKEKIILSVGRFFPQLHNKKQKEMVTVFKDLVEEGLKDTVLYLVGSIDPGAEELVETVTELAKGYPIKIVTQTTYDELASLYRKAKVYWHAAGFGEDLDMHPERAEHFGVATVEAMAHRAVPVVFAGGGQMEIVDHGSNGFVWRNAEELKKYTRELLKNEELRTRLADKAQVKSQVYTHDKFCERLHEILES